MEYASFPQQQPHNAHHPQAHLQGPYPSAQNGASTITSPNQQQLHPPSQTSPLMSQGHPYAQHPAQTSSSHHHQPLPYNPAYGVQPMQQYSLSTTQAAAAMATAAASGQHYYPMPNQGYVNHDNKVDARGNRSPPSGGLQHQIPGRRMSHANTSPVLQQSQPVMNAARPSTATMQPPTAATVSQHAQSPEVVAGAAEEAPLYVNAKQFHRILKRRLARQKLEEQLRLTSKARKPYLHESRHNHAMRRPRGPGGRFLTSEEVAELDRKRNQDSNGPVSDGANKANGTGQKSTGGQKRKSTGTGGGNHKRTKTGGPVKQPSTSADDDDDDISD
ncbi:hypothetical protein EJ06DRAFT_155419 [Trichodelitschia bisporula]|uniref:Transcriptional activator HAP2 n=1 Tax=Trichodelitschia bisporula TaxID=703511 RepID=A0A6G1HNW7_9PEZI|nr:hypothetical protein EJ06DRAFT_155419 [Trichodelitschia bisporula]